jgi:hypothetical protein
LEWDFTSRCKDDLSPFHIDFGRHEPPGGLPGGRHILIGYIYDSGNREVVQSD